METLFTMALTGTLCIVCFYFGVNTAQKVKEDKVVELPIKSPLKAIREHQEHRENKKQQDRLDTIMRNIEAYDGTGSNQKDVPR